MVPGACAPDCGGKECGDDGCGGACGFCGTGGVCEDGQCGCVPLTCLSASLHCGSGHADGCGGTFSCPGSCPPGLSCEGGWCGGPPGPCDGGACPAFPGAEGEGRFSKGGRGGDVCHVTTTADTGTGSLRACAQSQAGPRTVVFDVAGLITLNSPLIFNKDQLTLAGQTAPGDGIQIRGYQVQL
ncbi:MAG: pectate lyase, partial [Deltaproteobacteria bacterium]|nr:pectate lyase [Deltaproteobacteria bacterium]